MNIGSSWDPHKARNALAIPLIAVGCWVVPLGLFLIVH